MVTKQKLLEINKKIDTNSYPTQYGDIKLEGFESWMDFDAFEIDGILISPEDEYGREGQGDSYWRVIKVQEPREAATFWKIPGFYASSYGGELEFENIFQVVPKEKTITVWVDAKTKKED